MQATITYLLTEAAQRAAMAATGQPVARKQTMTIEVPAEDLHLFPVTPDGAITLDLTQSYLTDISARLKAAGWPTPGAGVAAAQIDPSVLDDLKRGTAILAERKQAEEALARANGEHNRRQTEAAYQAFLADPAARAGWSGVRDLVPDLRSPADWWPEAHKEFAAEIRRRNDADADAKKRREEELERAKTDYIAAWVSKHAEPDVQEQFRDGLLARKDALAMIASAAFEAAGVPAGEPGVSRCDDSNCPCGYKELDALPRAIYSAWKALRATLPDGYSVQFYRVRECLKDDGYYDGDGESAGPPHYTVDLKIPCGPFTFERENVPLG
jgi:hypothetical protein